jgi:hypothetical protein
LQHLKGERFTPFVSPLFAVVVGVKGGSERRELNMNARKVTKYIGKKHGELSVYGCRSRNNEWVLLCECDCGNKIEVSAEAYKNKKLSNCGCKTAKRKEKAQLWNQKICRAGKVFGNWEVLCRDTVTPNQTTKESRWWCRCTECGFVKTISRKHLSQNNLSPCMLCRKLSKKPSISRSRMYRIWCNMKQRCNGTKGENSIRYYAGRGIKYQPSWEKFENFYEDMKDGYADNLQLDRINKDGDYTKENCRWVSAKENCRNRRDNSFVTAGGETHVQAWWREKYGVSNADSLRRCLHRDYGDDWEIQKGHRHNWLDTPRYHICAQEEK